jgi:formate-dependent nitrite reductase membrane component NrfD
MREEIITSGRMNPNIDPVLHLWHWQIPFYLFVGGLAAGLLFFAAYYVITGKDKIFSVAVKTGPVISLLAIILGLIALVLDLKHPAYFWQLYTTIRLGSPMSWGAWTLLIIFFINVVWILSYLKELFPLFTIKNKTIKKILLVFIKEFESPEKLNWEWKFNWMIYIEKFSIKNRKAWAWVLIVFALILGVYTGILLSAFNARPLWNTSLLGPLFLTSGLSTGAALLMILSKTHIEKISFSRIDLMLIVIELFFITHLFMGFLAGPQVQAEAAAYFLGGDFTVSFWANVVIIGLIIPAVLEALELLKFKIPVIVPGLLILYGGLMFRFIMVEAGQVIRYLY